MGFVGVEGFRSSLGQREHAEGFVGTILEEAHVALCGGPGVFRAWPLGAVAVRRPAGRATFSFYDSVFIIRFDYGQTIS